MFVVVRQLALVCQNLWHLEHCSILGINCSGVFCRLLHVILEGNFVPSVAITTPVEGLLLVLIPRYALSILSE